MVRLKEFGDGKDSYDDLMEMSIAADMNSSSTTSTSDDETDGPFDENETDTEPNEVTMKVAGLLRVLIVMILPKKLPQKLPKKILMGIVSQKIMRCE